MGSGLKGGCGCGAVRYRLVSAPIFVQCCHCNDCRRQSGGAFVINGLIETDRIEVLAGQLTHYTMPTESGRPHDLHRCNICNTTLWSDYGRREVLSFLRIATLDEPNALPPNAHIFTRSKLPWIELMGAPEFDVYYDMTTLWPAESLARRRALLGDV